MATSQTGYVGWPNFPGHRIPITLTCYGIQREQKKSS